MIYVISRKYFKEKIKKKWKILYKKIRNVHIWPLYIFKIEVNGILRIKRSTILTSDNFILEIKFQRYLFK